MSENANTTMSPAKPRLTHGGIKYLGDEHDRRVTLHWAVANPWTEQAVMPPFTESDLSYTPFLPEQGQRDKARRLATASVIADQHEDRHWFYAHPFCYHCRGDEVMAHRSLETWMALHPSKDVPLGDDALPEPQVDEAEAASEFLSRADLRALAEKSTAWLIDGILPAGKHGIIRGRDASFKSFLALDFCLHIATAMDWQDRRTEQGRVLYLAGEGVTSFDDRFDSWEQTHGDIDEDEAEEILVRNGTVDLHGGGPAFDRLLAKVAEWKPRVLVADTLQRSAGAADQNSAADMALVRERMALLQQAAGGDCTTILVAHTTKGNGDTRGSSSIEDDADFVLSCDRSEMKLTVGVEKQKDGPDGFDVALAAVVVGKSLAIVGPKAAPPVEWSSSTLDNRILGALRRVAALDPLSKTEILAMVQSDDHGKDGASKSHVFAMIDKLLTDDRIIPIKVSATSTKYKINPSDKGLENL